MTNKQIKARVARLQDGEVVWFRDVHVYRDGAKWQVRSVGEDMTTTKVIGRVVTEIRKRIEPGKIIMIDTYGDNNWDGETRWYANVEVDGVDVFTTEGDETEQDARWVAQDWATANISA